MTAPPLTVAAPAIITPPSRRNVSTLIAAEASAVAADVGSTGIGTADAAATMTTDVAGEVFAVEADVGLTGIGSADAADTATTDVVGGEVAVRAAAITKPDIANASGIARDPVFSEEVRPT